MRKAKLDRKTNETEISVALDLDGTGVHQIETGVGFFDHMLDQLSRHSLIDMAIHAKGDLHIDDHHTVEDVGICLGKAIGEAIGDKSGLTRYGSITLPMEETLVTCALDLSGRVWFVDNTNFPTEKIGTFDSQLVREFCQAGSANVPMNLHLLLHHGHNSHHIAEAIFKAAARAFRQATTIDPRQGGIPSSKGVL